MFGMWEKELEEMKKAALLAEAKILEIYHSSFKVETKSDDSPVTEADKSADKIIKDYLQEKFPDYAFLTEESVDTKERLHKDFVFIIDPVDGTVEFVNKTGGFSTNIALCYKHEIVAGVINIPLEKTTYFATKSGGAWKEERDKNPLRIHVSDRVGKNLRALISISHLIDKEKEQIARHKECFESVTPCGAATKFCRIAEGEADVAVRYSVGTKEWDTAAGEILLEEAGGHFTNLHLEKYTHNREDVYNRDGYVVVNDMRNALL